MTEGWIDRQLKRVREDYETLPAWQKTAKPSNGGDSLAQRPRGDAESGRDGSQHRDAKPRER